MSAEARSPGIFLSHSHHDKPFVRRLAADLRIRGVRVWIDEAEILLGDSLLDKISSAIDEMDYVGAIISLHSVASEWVRRELNQAMGTEIKGRKVKVLPILIEECEVPGFLRDKLFADFRKSEMYDEGIALILRRLNIGVSHSSQAATNSSLPVRETPSRYSAAARALAVTSDHLLQLPHNAGLWLLGRCCRRAKELLVGNWLHGNSMWDTIGFVNKGFVPGIDLLVSNPSHSDYAEFFQSSLTELNTGLTLATRNQRKLRAPQVIFACMDIFIATAEYGLRGEIEFAERAFFGTYDVFGAINTNNSITQRDMRLDYQQVADAVRREKWSADTPITGFGDKLWRAGEPSWFNTALYQKVSLLDSLFG